MCGAPNKEKKIIRDPQKLDVPLTSVKGHESIINCIDSLNHAGEPAEIATGSRDGCVKVWDMRQPERAVLTIRSNQVSRDIWATVFGWIRGHKVIAVGYEDGTVQLFDVNGSQYVWETHVEGGVCSMDFKKDSLLISTLSGAYVIHVESGKTTKVDVKDEKKRSQACSSIFIGCSRDHIVEY